MGFRSLGYRKRSAPVARMSINNDSFYFLFRVQLKVQINLQHLMLVCLEVPAYRQHLLNSFHWAQAYQWQGGESVMECIQIGYAS